MGKKCFITQMDVLVNQDLPIYDGITLYTEDGVSDDKGTTVRLSIVNNPTILSTISYSGSGSLMENNTNTVVSSPYTITESECKMNPTEGGKIIIKNVSQLKQLQIQIANNVGSRCDFVDVREFLAMLPNVTKFGIDYRNTGINLIGDYTNSDFIKFLTQCVNGITFYSNNFPVDIDNLLTLIATEMSPSGNTTVEFYIGGDMMTNRPEGLSPQWSPAGSYVTFTNNTTTYPKGWYVSNSSGDPVN